MKALLAALVVLSAAPASAQNALTVTPPAPSRAVAATKPDGTLGAAIMSAIVSHTEGLVGGSGVVSSTNFGLGSFEVVFDRPVAGCALVASGGQVRSGTTIWRILANPWYSSISPYAVQVYLADPRDLSNIDGAFHLLVFCTK